MATHSSILAWRIPWKEEPGGLQSMGSQILLHFFTIRQNTFALFHYEEKNMLFFGLCYIYQFLKFAFCCEFLLHSKKYSFFYSI